MCVGSAEGGSLGLAHGVQRMWPQVTTQAIAVDHMMQVMVNKSRHVPVFGGDLRHHIIMHAPQDDEDVLHAAHSTSDSDEAQKQAQACMRGLVQQGLTKLAASGKGDAT